MKKRKPYAPYFKTCRKCGRLRHRIITRCAVCKRTPTGRGAVRPALRERLQCFNDGTACLSGGNAHPDRCVCQEKETGQFADTPHKHHGKLPYSSCGRCKCRAYEPVEEQ